MVMCFNYPRAETTRPAAASLLVHSCRPGPSGVPRLNFSHEPLGSLVGKIGKQSCSHDDGYSDADDLQRGNQQWPNVGYQLADTGANPEDYVLSVLVPKMHSNLNCQLLCVFHSLISSCIVVRTRL